MPSIAIVGCGLIGATHAECLAEVGSAPVAFFDADSARADQLATKFGGRAYRSLEAIIDDTSIEAVSICTYHDTHAPYTIQAASAHKHVFLEKPMAITRADCDAIVKAVEKNNVLCMTGFKLHYSSLARRVRELMPKPSVMVANVFDTRWPDDIWANDPKRGGGNVLSQGCHAVELLSYFAGSLPSRVFAVGGNLHHRDIDVIDSIAASIEYKSGAIANLTIADAGAMQHDGKFLFRLSNGAQTIELYDRLTKLTYFDGSETHEYSATEDGFLNENKEFLAALKEGRKPETNEITGLDVQSVLFEAITSAVTGQPHSF